MVKLMGKTLVACWAALSIAVGCAESDKRVPLSIKKSNKIKPDKLDKAKESLSDMGQKVVFRSDQDNEIDKIVDSFTSGIKMSTQDIKSSYTLDTAIALIENSNIQPNGNYKTAVVHSFDTAEIGDLKAGDIIDSLSEEINAQIFSNKSEGKFDEGDSQHAKASIIVPLNIESSSRGKNPRFVNSVILTFQHKDGSLEYSLVPQNMNQADSSSASELKLDFLKLLLDPRNLNEGKEYQGSLVDPTTDQEVAISTIVKRDSKKLVIQVLTSGTEFPNKEFVLVYKRDQRERKAKMNKDDKKKKDKEESERA